MIPPIADNVRDPPGHIHRSSPASAAGKFQTLISIVSLFMQELASIPVTI